MVRASGVHSRRVRPPYGYGLLRAKQEARKAQTLRSLMKVKSLRRGYLWRVFVHFFTCLLLALRVPDAASAAAADGELPGQGRAVPGQVAALCDQALSPHSAAGDPEPHLTHGVKTTLNSLFPKPYPLYFETLLSISFGYAAGQTSNDGSSVLWCRIYTRILCSAWLGHPDCSTQELSVLRRASSWETLL